jgi:hypothetical protein
MIRRLFLIFTVIIVAAKFSNESQAQNSTSDDSEILFVRRIAPLLREKCLGCHGNDPQEIEGSLDVRSLAGLLTGGDSNEPSIVAGKPDKSPLYLAASRQNDNWSEMPPKEAEQLSAVQLTWLRQWIASGARWPSKQQQETIQKKFAQTWSIEDGIPVTTSGGLSIEWTNRKYDPAGLWAYQPVTKVTIQSTGNPIDVLIEQSLPDGLTLARRADRRTLIRRATFDLTGLPPLPQEVETFVNDSRSDKKAFSQVVDRLLASPHYGERMAQHWLDVVRYADSSGFANDFERGNAWRYRDYVVRSFNTDKRYDQFVREQIAGDELNSNDPEMIVATGFLRMGPWELTGMEVAKVARQRFLDDVTNSVGETFLAHSLQCARCHDHKFDPVPTQDYYSIQAVFSTTQMAERKAAFLDSENTSGFEEQSYLRKLQQAHQSSLAELDRAMLENAQQWYQAKGTSSAQWDKAVKTITDGGRTVGIFNAARSALRASGLQQSDYPPKLVDFTPEQFGRERIARKGLQRLGWQFDRYKPYALSVYNGRTQSVANVSAPTRIPSDRMNHGELEQTAILTGGDPFSPSQEVSPGILSVVNDQVAATISDSIEGRRTGFANWVAAATNPLTTRAIANRLWLWHFGEPIAGNPNNFGSTGKRPTHPKLLDWLAATLVEDNWSIKAMHRRIMMSNTYCRSSHHPNPTALSTLDPQGDRYTVFKPRRLTAEELRDSMLAVTKELNTTLGGIPCRPEINIEVAMQPRQVMGTVAAAWVPNPQPSQRHRRSIYALKLRGMPHPMLEVFNTPAPDFSCERRDASTVTPQVFSLFNGQNTHTRALTLAALALQETDNDHDAVKHCFQLALAREPSPQELKEFLAHWRETEKTLAEKVAPRPVPPLSIVREAVEENTGERFRFSEPLYSNADFIADLQPADVDRHTRALSDLCLVILNSNEFVYIY